MIAGDLTLTIRSEPLREPPSLDELMTLHRDRVVRTAYRLLGRWEDAQDAAQEVFLRLVKHRERVTGDPRAWLYRVTVNVCNDYYRRRGPMVAAPEGMDHADPAAGPERALEIEERKRLLAAGLERLPERERAAVVLRDIEGLTTRQVAEILGVEEVTVRSQISVARVKLAKFVRSQSVRNET